MSRLSNKLRRSWLYLRFFFEPDDKALRAEAFASAKAHYARIPLRNAQHPYPRVVEYERRRNDFLAYQRAYNNAYRHRYATDRLAQLQVAGSD